MISDSRAPPAAAPAPVVPAAAPAPVVPAFQVDRTVNIYNHAWVDPTAHAVSGGDAVPPPSGAYIVTNDKTYYKWNIMKTAPFVPNRPFEIFDGPLLFHMFFVNHYSKYPNIPCRWANYYSFLTSHKFRHNDQVVTLQDMFNERISTFWQGIGAVQNEAELLTLNISSPLISSVMDQIMFEPNQVGDVIILASVFDYPNPSDRTILNPGEVSFDTTCINLSAQYRAGEHELVRGRFESWMAMMNNVKYKLYFVKLVPDLPPHNARFGNPLRLSSFIQKYKRIHPKTPDNIIVAKYKKALKNLQAYT